VGKGQVQVEDLHRALEVEISRLRTGADWSGVLDIAAMFPEFGFGNIVLIKLQMPQASWVAHARTWQLHGRRVRSGQAIKVLGPLRSLTAGEDAERSYGGDGPVEQQAVGFRVTNVYDVTATDGDPVYLPRTPSPDTKVARTLWDGLAKEAAADGFVVDVRPTGDGSEGFTNHRTKTIVVADHLDDFRALTRLAHEVGHARMHSPEGLADVGGVMCRGVCEVEAESVAYVVLAHHGLSSKAESFDCITDWAQAVDPDEPANVIKATGARVVNTARQLIEATDKYLAIHRASVNRAPGRMPDSALSVPGPDGPTM
jgi:hypothetical protein